MTKEEILAMKAGKELDASIEESLFNHQCEMRYCNWLPEGYFEVQSYGASKEVITGGLLDENKSLPCYKEGDKWTVTPLYSTNPLTAWLVVEKVNKMGYGITITVFDPSQMLYPKDKVQVEVNDIHKPITESTVIAKVLADDFPEAICKAALLSKYSTRNT